jgi:radical S-adenosyl methionine domain-containing protein 2
MTEICNYRCKFCFAKYNVNNQLCDDLDKSKKLIRILKAHGTEKITFTGGEPLLCKNLGEIIKFAKGLEITTCIVTNGYYLTEPLGLEFLENYGRFVDWIGISIDSQYEEVEKAVGRGFGDHVRRVKSAVDLIRNNHPHVKLKINTVVFKYNWKEDMHGLIEELKPDRWKVFQVKLIENVNDEAFNLGITKDLFMDFVKRHENLNPIWEDNDLMTDSYIMIDPQGRFFNDNDCLNNPRKSILEVGVRKAFDGIRFNYKKFLKRGGYYRW